VATLTLRGLGCCPGLLVETTDILCRTLIRVLEIISSM